ncbi:unnamed protein product [Pylaiella littoralis]
MSMYRVLRRVSRHLSAASRHLLATNRPVTTTGSCSGNESVSNYEQFRDLAVTEPATAVMQVEINRPDKANAMSSSFFAELGDCFGRLAVDPACRAIVLCGSGNVFSSGLDLEEHAPTFLAMTSPSPAGDLGRDPARKSFEIARFVSGMQESLASIDRCPKPVICAVHSACIGGGVDLVCATDIRLASSDAWFSIKEASFQRGVDIGLCADLGTLQRLPKLIGSDSLARELVFTARKFPAAEALKAGFLSTVLDDKQELMDHAVKLGSQIAARSPVAMQGSKVNLNYGRDHTIAQALQHQALWSSVMLQTGDIPAAMMSAQKRKPPPPFPPL